MEIDIITKGIESMTSNNQISDIILKYQLTKSLNGKTGLNCISNRLIDNTPIAFFIILDLVAEKCRKINEKKTHTQTHKITGFA